MSGRASRLEAMLKALECRRDDRGFMADIRAGLRENTQMKAWPCLSHFCDLTDGYRSDVFRTVAGLYATHPETREGMGMGHICKQLCDSDEKKTLYSGGAFSEDVKEGPVTKRMKQLLDSDRDEICERVIRIILYAKSKEIPVDYLLLGNDLLFWGDHVRRRWAQEFWGNFGSDILAEQTEEEGESA